MDFSFKERILYLWKLLYSYGRRNLNNRKVTQEEILEAEEELKNGTLYTES